MTRWGRNYGRTRKCGQRRTSDEHLPVVCSRVADGSHSEHRGRERGAPWRWFVWQTGGPLSEAVR